MGQAESSDPVPGTAAEIVEQNNMELLSFLFLLLLTLVVCSLLAIVVIFVFFPSLTKHNPNCIPVSGSSSVTNASQSASAAAAAAPRQGAFNSFGSWLYRIRTTTPPKHLPTN